MATWPASTNSMVVSVVLIFSVGSFRSLECQRFETFEKCLGSRAVCVPEQLCPIMQELKECGAQHPLVKQEVRRRQCSSSGSSKRVYCEPEDLKYCTMANNHRGRCVAKEQCVGHQTWYQSRVCHQEGGKEYYCCPEKRIFSSSDLGPDGVENAYFDSCKCQRKGLASCRLEVCSGKSTWIPHPKAPRLALDKCGPMSMSDNIFGGSEVDSRAYPWVASILYKNAEGRPEIRCGGTLIHPRYVLTAAHCVAEDRPSWAYFENCTTFDGSRCHPLSAPIEHVIVHHNYKRGVLNNDIALLKLSKEVQLSPVCLPLTKHLLTLLPRKLIVVGRGKTRTSSNSDKLLEAEVEVTACYHGRCYGDDSFCVDRSQNNNGGGHCRGDSGGPLQQLVDVGQDSSQFVQFGVISTGHPYCGGDGGTEVSVGYHIQWILNVMNI